MKKFLIVTALVWACLPLFAQHFTVDYTSQPQTYMNVYVFDAQIGGVDLANGDEIAVFDGNICCGVFLLQKPRVLAPGIRLGIIF